jgi:hypothetical protein
MKIKNQVFMSFTNKEEYLYAVGVWKWNMGNIVTIIRNNNWKIKKYQKDIDVKNYTDFFLIESLNYLRLSQNDTIILAKVATDMLKIRAKMKKLAGQQMEANRLQEKELVGV